MSLNGSAEVSPTLYPVDNCTNIEGFWELLATLQPIYLTLISAIGLLGNGFVLCIFCLQRKASCSVPDVYLGNLAAADLVLVICLPFWAVTIANNFDWVFGVLFCKLVSVAIYMNYFCSVLFLVLVSVDRYLALVQPMRPSCLRRAPWAKRICLAIWLLGLLLSLPVLLFRTVAYVPEARASACFLAYPHQGWRVQHNITVNVVGFLVPLPVVTFCTYHIIKALRNGGPVGVAARGMRNERKATQLVLAVLIVFVFCWMPYQVVRALDTIDYFRVKTSCWWGDFMDVSEQLVVYLAYSNSAVNPFLYVIVGKHFRRKARAVLKQCWPYRSKGNASFSGNASSLSRETRKISLNRIDKLMC
ncbi:B2 bradykinin receptor [Alosa sapidissima]|uniref:B2 bradykinin receptor n=1 Tax=Alosa sapidissima TaxID=34773 RepID=UPI001C086C82|nr:B2 bradykinin receptor [Alosa sapidissima]